MANPINTLYDYFTSKGQALPSQADRFKNTEFASAAKTAGYDQNSYNALGANNANANTAILRAMQGGGGTPQVAPTPSPVANGQQFAPATSNMSNGQTPAPTTPPQEDYLKKYLANLAPTADETQTQDQLTTLEGATRQGVAGLEGRGLGIPLQLVRGQQAQLEKQGQLQQQTLRQKLANLQSQRKSAIDVSKTILDRADAAAKTVSDREYETQKTKLANEQKANTPYTLSQGQTRYDAKGNVLSSVAPKPVASKTTSSTKGTTKSGGLNYTPQMAAEDTQALENSRGTDNYVDPTVYQNLYQAWVDNDGLLKDFLVKYPPKLYVNPANTWLPQFLMPAKTKSTSKRTI